MRRPPPLFETAEIPLGGTAAIEMTLGHVALVGGSHTVVYAMVAVVYGVSWRTYLPDAESVGLITSFYGLQLALAQLAPGISIEPSKALQYRCNAYASLLFTLLLAWLAHTSGCFDLARLVDLYPKLLTCSMLSANLLAIVVFFAPCRFDVDPETRTERTCETFVMGRSLHPRIGAVDIKMLAEVRVSWNILLLVTVGCLLRARREGHDGGTMALLTLCLGHALYTNACAKGEHWIPFTWDMTTERFGWMLSFWNLCGVPFVYTHNSVLVASRASTMAARPALFYVALWALLLSAYYLWDVANAHKNEYRARERGVVITRRLFPTFAPLPESPRVLRLPNQRTMLLHGTWGWARKFHYTMDVVMAAVWAAAALDAGVSALVYPSFMAAVLAHRCLRDEEHCAEKYGKSWEVYTAAVPYRFVPGVI